jgi:hypothetical protein
MRASKTCFEDFKSPCGITPASGRTWALSQPRGSEAASLISPGRAPNPNRVAAIAPINRVIRQTSSCNGSIDGEKIQKFLAQQELKVIKV